MMDTPAPAGETGSRAVETLARRHSSLVSVARVGWVAKGVVYILLGVLALPIAFQGPGHDDGGSGGDQASQTGAVARLAESSFGALALWIVATGLLLYALWRLTSIVLPAENSAKAWLTRAGYAVSALVYLALAWSAVSFARHVGSSSAQDKSEDAKVERITRDLMERSGGRWLIGLVGIVIVCVGVFFVIRGVRASFRDELEHGGVGPVSHESIVTLGRIGWVGRGLMMAVVGWFVTRAAVRFQPDEAKGMDGALREVTGSTAGSLLVGFVALALIVYGAFCVISAPRERLVGAD
jgi:hypothetical protein